MAERQSRWWTGLPSATQVQHLTSEMGKSHEHLCWVSGPGPGTGTAGRREEEDVSRGWRPRQGHLTPAALIGADWKAKTVTRDDGHSSWVTLGKDGSIILFRYNSAQQGGVKMVSSGPLRWHTEGDKLVAASGCQWQELQHPPCSGKKTSQSERWLG